MTKQYNKEQVKQLISKAIHDADQEIWEQMKGRPKERERLMAAADALDTVTDNLYRLIGGLT